ncbi:hypothetical protein SAMN05216354_0219 [Xylanibacter ruminicola]|uniref:Uncharacterized protein n=1 Tax=Xylanibacter ruminicola TaxID=839 RepID=A0A1H5RNH2_XYLRU|nr:hypothetical protein [Xylanibacter ruminicola]SEF39654.1 hypothetical protein SAMN05216354_0219 [Xylanibacter ruminicola]
MASLDELIRQDELENQQELAFIRSQIPADMKGTFSDDDILYIMDSIVDYYFTSGILDGNEEETDIDMEKVAEYVCKQAKEANVGTFDPQDVFFIVQADLDFQEQNL